jgi:hypothetical protein
VATALGVAMDRRQQMAATAERYREMARDRKELKRRKKTEGLRLVGTPERVRAWAACLAQTGQLQPEALVKGIAFAEQPERHILLEGIHRCHQRPGGGQLPDRGDHEPPKDCARGIKEYLADGRVADAIGVSLRDQSEAPRTITGREGRCGVQCTSP